MKSFRKYAEALVGIEEISKVPNYSSCENVANRAAKGLKGQYDTAIPLANSGLWLGWIFEQHGYKVKPVKLHRTGKGATWKPLVDIQDEDIREKRILLLENDIVTGRTLKKAAQELEKYSPEFVDILLCFSETPIQVSDYKKWKRYGLPLPVYAVEKESNTNYKFVKVLLIKETDEGIEMSAVDSNGEPIELALKDKDKLVLDTQNQSYDGIRKIMSIYDF